MGYNENNAQILLYFFQALKIGNSTDCPRKTVNAEQLCCNAVTITTQESERRSEL